MPLAPYLSVTFNQPMVALTSLADLAANAVPVKLSPLPAGKWRWVGTKTLMFEPSGRFPMATKYTVEIPAGTKSATGGTLAEAGDVDLHHAAAHPQELLSDRRPTAARRADVRRLRSAD